MSVIDNVACIEFVQASDPEMNNDLHLCSTETYIYSLTEIDAGNKLSGMTVSHDVITTDFSDEVKSLQPQIAKLALDVKRKQLEKSSF